MFGFSVETDWSRKWREFSGPVKERSNERFLERAILYVLMMMVHHFIKFYNGFLSFFPLS